MVANKISPNKPPTPGVHPVFVGFALRSAFEGFFLQPVQPKTDQLALLKFGPAFFKKNAFEMGEFGSPKSGHDHLPRRICSNLSNLESTEFLHSCSCASDWK